MPREKIEEKFLGHVDTLDTLLAKSNWLVGGERSIADIAVASQLAEIARTSHLASEIANRKHVGDWLARN